MVTAKGIEPPALDKDDVGNTDIIDSIYDVERRPPRMT
jgi:hypothetical protein